jgi:hypothetical protein
MNLTEDVTLTNKAVLTGANLPTGGVTATGTVDVLSTKLMDKSMAGHENPAYVEYALNINPNGSDLVSGDTLEVVDIMGTGMSLATARANNFKVYDVTNVSDLLDEDGNVIAAKAQNGTDVTDQYNCTVEDITGKTLDGMTADEVGKPAYKMTVPDGKHLVILYWATFEGAAGENVTVSNKASFFYNSVIKADGGDEISNQIAAADATSDFYVGSFFSLKKTDQYGNAVSRVKYTLYEVTLNTDGTVSKTEKMNRTTDADGMATFGGTDINTELFKDKLYCLVETEAPAGYKIDSEPYYFEFKENGNDAVTSPSGFTLHQFVVGGTYSFTNVFTPASYSVPVKKTINGKNISSDLEFSFTLKQSSEDSETVYTDESCKTAITEDGIKAKIKGSGNTTFDKLYFTKEGTYTFTMTEDDLTEDAINKKYSKDTNTFTVKLVVGSSNNQLTVTSAEFTSDSSSGDMNTSVPTFNNTSSLKGTITLHATKVVANRALPVQAGEFKFTVSKDGEVLSGKDANGNTVQEFRNDANGDIVFNID